MKQLLAGRGTPAFALAVITLVIAAGGAAYAATSGSGAISACVHKKGGGLYKASRCARGDSKLTWSVTGPQGPAGKNGTDGTDGTNGKNGADGTNGTNGTDGAAGPGAVRIEENAVEPTGENLTPPVVFKSGNVAVSFGCFNAATPTQATAGISVTNIGTGSATVSYDTWDQVESNSVGPQTPATSAAEVWGGVLTAGGTPFESTATPNDFGSFALGGARKMGVVIVDDEANNTDYTINYVLWANADPTTSTSIDCLLHASVMPST